MPNCIKVPQAAGFDEIIKFNRFALDCVPWPEQFPYKPKVEVSIAHSDKSLLIRFDVEEEGCRAVCTESNGPVWEDSCVEFFVKESESDYYYNFETSCIGIGLAGKRKSRSDFRHFTPEEMAHIKRRASLPCKPFEAKGVTKWSIDLEVPFKSIGCGAKQTETDNQGEAKREDACLRIHGNSVPGTLLANFYKCGDKTLKPHYLSWSPVLTPSPDFHRPEYFGKLELIW